ncbi:MAG: hypothetical protein ABS81_15780 [Pseudonocardia sp. SCN 72-86]|nr:MAG: hypothetical protein ABS81_15780 [Pseudonocardia sp. SCN 72-86]
MLTMFAAACSTTGGAPTGRAAPTTLTLTTGFAIDDLDPLENAFWGPEFGYVELLMKPELGGSPSPWVLRTLTNPSPQTWVLTLNDKVAFQDGRALDGGALAELITYQLANNKEFAAALPGATAAASGPLEVTLTTAKPAPNVPFLLADEAMVPVYDSAAYQKHKASGAPATDLLKAGLYTAPYKFDSLDSTLGKLSAWPQYWGGTPPLSAVTIKFVPEASARLQAVQAGEADIALYPPTATAQTLTGRSDSFFVTGDSSGPTFMLEFNQRTAPFNDPLVRRAVYAGIDYDELANKVMNGLYTPAIGLYAESRPWAVKTQTFDAAAAGTLLDQAGFTRTGDAPRSRGGAPLTFDLLTYPQQPDSGALALAVQAQLAKIGITVTITQVPDITESVEKPTGWQASIRGNGFISFGGDYVTPLLNYVRTGGTDNVTGVSDPALDALIDQVAVTLDPATRDDLLRRIQTTVGNNGYLGYLGQRKGAVVAGASWRNYPVPISNLWVGPKTAPPATTG